jgi:hypothetical protein
MRQSQENCGRCFEVNAFYQRTSVTFTILSVLVVGLLVAVWSLA